MFEKSKYFNNHQTASSLMIDDVVPLAVTYDGKLLPNNDWGYGKMEKNSLFDYLNNTLFKKFPEIKGTFFIPFESQNNLPKDTGMSFLIRNFDESYKNFFNFYQDRFEIAFHGVKHLYYPKNSIKNESVFEFSELKLKDYSFLKDKIYTFEQLYEIKLEGGKFPGYHRKNNESFELLLKLGFKWWAFTLADSKISKNDINLIELNNNSAIIDIPSNLNGNAFSLELGKTGSFLINNRRLYKYLVKQISIRKYIEYLYQNRLPITIQEHAQNQSLNGIRQRPNLYDDIESLELIYSLLRGKDIWYCTNGELAQYFDAYMNTELIESETSITLKYSGNWKVSQLTIHSTNCSKLILGNKEIRGILKDNKFIFNNLKPAEYTKSNSY
jgi:hypothetical protein